MKAIYTLFIVLVHSALLIAGGPTLKNNIQEFIEINKNVWLKEYAKPLSLSFGSSLSGSNYQSAQAHSFPHFDIGINYSYVPIGNKYKMFDEDDLDAEIPTVFGNAGTENDSIFGLSMDAFQLPVLQLNFGIGDNTDILLKYMSMDYSKIGKIQVLGGGVKYELENLFSFSRFPFSIGVLALYQKFFIDDYIEGAVFGMNLISSKQIGVLPIVLYGSAGYVNNVMNVDNPLNKEESYSVPGLEEIRYKIGANFSLAFISLNAEYNFGTLNSYSAGLHFVF